MTLTPALAAWLADITVALHAAYVLFVVGGQAFILVGWARGWLAARNRIFRLLHLAGIGFVVLESWLGARCPLTVLENHLRQLAGGSPLDISFVGYWLRYLLFYNAPEWVFTVVYTLFAAAVITTWLVYPPRRRG